MTDPARRTLNPGGGAILRRTYGKLLAVSVVAAVLVWLIAVSVVVALAGDGDGVLVVLAFVVLAFVVLAVTSVCLLAAIVRARAAIHGDQVGVAALHGSDGLSRTGSAVGWVGAAALVVLGFVLNTQDVDNALLSGIVLAGTAVILAVGNDGTHRITKRLIAA
ncbi:hypothetical protein JIG36_35245 [Actinoplanes sp. LDG1-06]|uniref:Integral membrane protein n=1 Tax=Paractinoplanes ovalisporus TaxID=2810368 RepID=A0ABS2ALN8_9ACTN|nr:hypothetical protein [Actinoplanes ovalisporus]MBM2620769.1 hypothetical protein [Actinoplanes ovalisporus]